MTLLLNNVNYMLNSKLYCALGYACNNNCLICIVDSKKKAKANLQTAEIIDYLKILDTNPQIKKELDL